MENNEFIHAIEIDKKKCIGCSHCMKVCPTEAIRISRGNATLNADRCVDCGECFRVCPTNAIFVKDDGLAAGGKKKYRVALVPAVFIGQFPSEYTASQILDAVRETGFDEVFEVEQAVDFVKSRYASISRQKDSALRPFFSSFCPAIVRLIQVRYPSFTDQILNLKAPHDIAALYLRKRVAQNGINPEDIVVEYISPCAAKIVAAKVPEGEDVSPIDKVINMMDMYNQVSRRIYGDKNKGASKLFANMTPDSVNWSCSGTEKNYFDGRCLAIDGTDNVIDFLEKLELGQIADIDFLEMRMCDQGCAGGILCPGNRFLTVERLEQRQKKLAHLMEDGKGYHNALMTDESYLTGVAGTSPIRPRNSLFLDENMSFALRKMDRINKLMSYLPGFDCGACGAPGCRSLAEDIVKDKARISHCVFVQRFMEKNYKLSPEQAFQVIEGIWGEDRLSKYKIKDSYEKKESGSTD